VSVQRVEARLVDAMLLRPLTYAAIATAWRPEHEKCGSEAVLRLFQVIRHVIPNSLALGKFESVDQSTFENESQTKVFAGLNSLCLLLVIVSQYFR